MRLAAFALPLALILPGCVATGQEACAGCQLAPPSGVDLLDCRAVEAARQVPSSDVQAFLPAGYAPAYSPIVPVVTRLQACGRAVVPAGTLEATSLAWTVVEVVPPQAAAPGKPLDGPLYFLLAASATPALADAMGLPAAGLDVRIGDGPALAGTASVDGSARYALDGLADEPRAPADFRAYLDVEGPGGIQRVELRGGATATSPLPAILRTAAGTPEQALGCGTCPVTAFLSSSPSIQWTHLETTT